ncbi:15776_t:CDS:2 [Rhizophagus irregularis]|nr:15776_t:CDS:2 [Rhizophagus irregularis]
MKQYPSACSEFFISSSIDMEIICTQTFSSRIRRRACGLVLVWAFTSVNRVSVMNSSIFDIGMFDLNYHYYN